MPYCLWVVAGVLCSLTLSSGRPSTSARVPELPADTSGLSPFLGTWLGEGRGLGVAIRDSLVFAATLGGRALRFSMVSRTEDRFEAEGYVWTTELPGQVELVEFSTVAPFRHFLGSRTPDALVIDEVPPERHTRVRLDLSGGALRLQEMDTRVDPPRVFVDEMFRHPTP